MNRKTRSFQPHSTELESKLLLSHIAAPDAAEVSILADRSAAVANMVHGRYFAVEDNRAADAPLHVNLNGDGRVNGIGKAKLSGSLDLGGFRVAGSQDVSGRVTFTNAKGTVKLRLSGSGGFADVPNGRFVTMAATVKGTGAYRGFQRSGTVTFHFGENQARSIKAPSPIGGSMTVTLSLKPAAS